MSSHGDDHLTKEEVAERVLSVVKSFPKIDPSQVTPDVHFQKDLGLDSLDNVEIVMAHEGSSSPDTRALVHSFNQGSKEPSEGNSWR